MKIKILPAAMDDLSDIDYEEEEIRQTWIEEVEARMKAVKEGRAKLLDYEALYEHYAKN